MPRLNSDLYECTVLHHRFAPKTHRFVYRLFLFALDLDELPALHRRLTLFSFNRANLFSFHEADFFPTHEPLHNRTPHPGHEKQAAAAGTLKARVSAYVAARGIDLTGGRVVLVTLPRVLGYLFNPVSFYFCYNAAGSCVASLAEVTNTFKEIKPYFLGPETRRSASATGESPAVTDKTSPAGVAISPPQIPFGDSFHLRTPKHFYVSPFSDVDVAFDFTLRNPGERLSIQIDDYVGTERTLTSTLAGPRRELTDARLAWFTLKYPLLTVRIILLIHWHAFRLWLRRLPWFSKAARATDQRDLYRPHHSVASAHPPTLKNHLPTEVA